MIKRIILEVDGKEIKLTPKQAKALKAALLDLWPEPVAVPYVPYPVYPQPLPYDTGTPSFPSYPVITCKS
jgi:hypothetical protein